jgi:hypothetical protein
MQLGENLEVASPLLRISLHLFKYPICFRQAGLRIYYEVYPIRQILVEFTLSLYSFSQSNMFRLYAVADFAK